MWLEVSSVPVCATYQQSRLLVAITAVASPRKNPHPEPCKPPPASHSLPRGVMYLIIIKSYTHPSSPAKKRSIEIGRRLHPSTSGSILRSTQPIHRALTTSRNPEIREASFREPFARLDTFQNPVVVANLSASALSHTAISTNENKGGG